MRSLLALLVLALVVAGCGGDDAPRPSAPAAATAPAPEKGCVPSRVRHDPYPGTGNGLSGIPWVRGEPASSGLVALLWYWPPEWRRVQRARIYTGGVAPGGWNMKVMWVWLGDAARSRGGSTLVVRGRRLGGRGSFEDTFGAIGYAGQDGAPSFASIIEVPRPGCWRLTLTTEGLRGTVTMRAVRG